MKKQKKIIGVSLIVLVTVAIVGIKVESNACQDKLIKLQKY